MTPGEPSRSTLAAPPSPEIQLPHQRLEPRLLPQRIKDRVNLEPDRELRVGGVDLVEIVEGAGIVTQPEGDQRQVERDCLRAP